MAFLSSRVTTAAAASFAVPRAYAVPTDGATLVVPAHADDELLWFLPWLADAYRIVKSALYGFDPLHQAILERAYGPGGPLGDIRYKFVDIHPRYASVGDWLYDYLDRPPCRDAARAQGYSAGRDDVFSYDRIREALRPWVADPAVQRIVTHNHWGEYGHAHHRMVAAICRELAREYGKDVWMPGVVRNQFTHAADEPGVYYRDAAELGLTRIDGVYPHAVFNAIRTVYQRTMMRGDSCAWSWHPFQRSLPANQDYPYGLRAYGLIVQRGVDLTGACLNPILAIRNTECRSPIGTCASTQQTLMDADAMKRFD